MQKTPTIIDIFVNVVDNYGDMGFASEFILACQREFGEEFEYVIWTNEIQKVENFIRQAGILDISVVDIVDFGKMRKSAIGIFLLHSPLPDLDLFEENALILRIDYLSMDPIWIENNEIEHIASTRDRQIIELIPSPLIGGAGLILYHSGVEEMDFGKGKHITIFSYSNTLDCIDWDSFSEDLTVYVFGKVNSERKNIVSLDFLSNRDFYNLLDTSEFVMIRGEVSFAHVIQGSVPFFWDMYKDIGGFPAEQSEQALSLIDASPEYREIHEIINGQKLGKITYQSMVSALSHTRFPKFRIQNLIHTVKKHIDRFHNSI